MQTHFIVHDKADSVGVMVVENAQAGQDLTGWIMETDETITLKALSPKAGSKIYLLGDNKPVTWSQQGDDIKVDLPSTLPGHYAYVLKIMEPTS